jgi:Flagellar biosynthesis protein, FliO
VERVRGARFPTGGAPDAVDLTRCCYQPNAARLASAGCVTAGSRTEVGNGPNGGDEGSGRMREARMEPEMDRLPGGLTGWLLKRLRLQRRERPRLELLERIALAPRQSLALVEAEGRRFLVATSAESGPALYALDTDVPMTDARPNGNGSSSTHAFTSASGSACARSIATANRFCSGQGFFSALTRAAARSQQSQRSRVSW